MADAADEFPKVLTGDGYAATSDEAPSVSPFLVEHLKRMFALRLHSGSIQTDPGAVVAHHWLQRGQQSVLDYLDNLSKKDV
jgi:hypothetical protein